MHVQGAGGKGAHDLPCAYKVETAVADGRHQGNTVALGTKTASGGNAANGRKWRRWFGRRSGWLCPQDAAVSDFFQNLTQRPHSLCYMP